MKTSTKNTTAKKVKAALSPEIQARLNKALDRITNPRPKPIEFRAGPSISDRVAKITTLVTLVAAAAAYDNNEELSKDDVLDAIKIAANKAASELYWLNNKYLPASIGNLPALTDDEYQDAGVDATEADNRDEFCHERMREMLDGAR